MKKKVVTISLLFAISALIIPLSNVEAWFAPEFEDVIITFDEFPSDSTIRELERRGIIKHVYELIPAVAMSMPINQQNEVIAMPQVSHIDIDEIFTVQLDSALPVIRAAEVHALGIDGTGIRVCMLDTGMASHSALPTPILQIDFVNTDLDAFDDNGHGTWTTGIVASKDPLFRGTAPGVDLMIAKVLSSTGGAPWSKVMLGVEWCVFNGADIISMSLAGNILHTQPCDDNIVGATVNRAVIEGVVVVVASGNSGSQVSLKAPACASLVIAVGATTDFDIRAPFSDGGPLLDVVAPGRSITSTYLGNSFLSSSGTSASAPFVTGTVALMLQNNPTLHPFEVESILEENAVDLGDPGFDFLYGHGRIDSFVSVFGPAPPPPPRPDVSIDDISLFEGNSGLTDFLFTVTRSDNIDAISVDFATSDGTARLLNNDYVVAGGTLTFNAGGLLSKTITVQVIGDTNREPNETFFVNLSNCAGCDIIDNQGQGTIQNDDAPPGKTPPTPCTMGICRIPVVMP